MAATVKSEWSDLGDRLRVVDPEKFEELLIQMRNLVEACEVSAELVATGSELTRAIISAPNPAPPRTRQSR